MKLLNLLPLAGLALASSIPTEHTYREKAVLPRQASTSQQPNFTFNELYELQIKFLDNFVYPNNTKQVELLSLLDPHDEICELSNINSQRQAKAINSTLLAEDVLGRVDITRTFNGRELNTEYLFGLFANLAADNGQISLLGVPISYEILHFAANQNIVSASTKFMFNFTALNLILPLRIDSWNTYNAAGQISQYDATFVWWDWAVTTLFQAAAPLFKANSTATVQTAIQQALAKSICGTATQYCNGTNVQYKSADQCYQQLTTQVRFGQPWELGRNTLLCRMVHQNMVPYRPDVHCPHIGPTGGGYCTDNTDYAGTVSQNYFTNSPYVPFGAGASKPPVAGPATS